MKKPKIKAFDSTHPIWEEVRDWMIERYATTGVFFDKSHNTAYCTTCGWHGSYTAYENHQYVCPACSEKKYQQFKYPNYAGALIIDKKDNIVIFRFIGFQHRHTAMGPSFTAYEMFRIYTDEKEYEIHKSSGNTFKKCDHVTLSYCPELAEKDIYPYHTYDANLHGNAFVESLSILFEEAPLAKVFETIAQNAAVNNIAKTCPKFVQPLPDATTMLNTNYIVSVAENHIEVRKQGNATLVDAWCAHCGTHTAKTFPPNQTYMNVPCTNCGNKIPASSQHNSSSRNGTNKHNLIIDVQFDKQCTTLRYCTFTVTKSVITPTIAGVNAQLAIVAEVASVYYACCFADGEVIVFDSKGNPITYMEEANIVFANTCLNPDIYEKIKDDEFIKETGYVDYITKEDDWSFKYFLGYMRSEVAKELTMYNLHGLIADISQHDITLPTFLEKKKKFPATLFTEEHKEDFGNHNVRFETFCNFMQAFKKDSTIFYSDYLAMEKFCSKSNIAEIYRRIPDACLHDVLQYLSYLNVYEGLPPTESVSIWCNYLKTANRNDADMTDKNIAYPKGLKVALDVEITKWRQKQYTEQEINEFAETAQKVPLSFENERWKMSVIKTIDEYRHYSAALCHQSNAYDSFNLDEFAMLIFDKKKNAPTAIVHICGYFVNNKLASGSITKVYTFGNTSYCHNGRTKAHALIAIPSEVGKMLKAYAVE